jgi:hypothetical protein
MKKIYLLIVVLTLFSCQESEKEIIGFGGFDIGSDLSSHEKFADFRNTMPDEYFCNSMKLSDEIGLISNINITTEYGKIIEVKFATNEHTNIEKIQKQLKTLNSTEKAVNFRDEFFFKSYTTMENKVIFIDIENKNELMKNGKAKHEFSYSNKKAIENNNKLINSMLNNITTKNN